jgi:pilus assembly protein CpaF
MLVGMAAPELPMAFIHRQIASAIHIVVHTARLAGGARKVMQISEITGCQADAISMHDVFLFEQTGVNEHLDAEGHFCATGIRPSCLERLKRAGIDLPMATFERGPREFDRYETTGLEMCAR